MNFFRKTATLILGLMFCTLAFAQNQGETDFFELAAQQANGLGEQYELDYAQIFKIDTMYQRVLPMYSAELEDLQKKGFSNSDIYQNVSDMWNDYIDKVLESIFTPAQWKKYMKSPAGKEIERRNKRMAKFKESMGQK